MALGLLAGACSRLTAAIASGGSFGDEEALPSTILV